MMKVTQQFKLLDIHYVVCVSHEVRMEEKRLRTCVQLPSELGNCNPSAFQFSDEHIFEASATDFLELSDLLWRNLAVVETQAFQVKLKLGLKFALVGYGWCLGRMHRGVGFTTAFLATVGPRF